jgi:hypothetical protein
MTDIGAKVYRMCMNSRASHGNDDAHLEWIHPGQEVVRHADYEIALKRILELEQEIESINQNTQTMSNRMTTENEALKAELDQLLTVHAKLKDAYHIRGERMQELWDFCKNIETYKEHLAKWFTDKGKIK